MKKALLLASLLICPAWCAAPGLTTVNASLYRDQTDVNPDGGLRGALTFRNDSGQSLTKVKVNVHILDGYGRPIFDYPNPEIARMQPKQVETISIYRPVYAGSVAIFQLSADVDAQGAGGPQHFVLPPHDATGGNNYAPNYKTGF